MSQTMTALLGGTGPDWEAREVAVPEPGPGQVLVRARAVALNNADVHMLADAYDPATGRGKEYVAGFEFAGEVVALGPGADRVAVGERIMGTTQGAFAQYVLADHRHVLRIPEGLDDEEAAALPTGLLTEHGALEVGGFRPGQSVLITGATSSIGLIGVQIAKALGAKTVVATSRSAAKEDLLKDAGADVVVVPPERDLTAAVLETTDGEGVDLVLDHVGGQTLADCLAATRVDGNLVNIGRLDTAEATINLDSLSYRHLRLQGVSFGFSRAEELGNVIAALVPDVIPAVADGRVRPVIDSVFTFGQATDAADRLRSNQSRGKIVLTQV
ncbi:quinone oxidoreductase family protein [Rhodococcus jostii]|uniref:NADPH:quinone reductase n=1 Tax=Rhodococcus jostii TaxID=132919 RepID=A0A1H5EZB2_RHOJO|nr:zinc-binding dehydrogenase [Rhodococcus jostii]SED96419.1 NADPH:quinone reductase [Rhodococcus jostii]